ncbi:MAG TPA: hypothetical protein VG992_04905, partial [Candidatus Saccharimonadales bacterium]|nr:hypothetical protein [Candidatus Saccharimonadales bacterium]
MSSPACETLSVTLTDNNDISAPPVDYTVTIQLGSQPVGQDVESGMIGGSSVSANYPNLPAGTYTVLATGSDGSTATPVSQAVASCSTPTTRVAFKPKASIGTPNYRAGNVPVKL